MSDAALSWDQARRVATAAVQPRRPVAARLDSCLGCALAAPIEALTDLPAFDTAAMDGFAVGEPINVTIAVFNKGGCSALLGRAL